MTDLEINVALAKALGWGGANDLKWDCNVFCWSGERWKIFDYRDPVIFVAICKHWHVTVVHSRLKCWRSPEIKDFYADTIEKAAALCVIDAAKRSVK